MKILRLVCAVLIVCVVSGTVRGNAADITWVLDAGHGGEDGGAVSGDGTEEASLNLDIVRRMRAYFGLFGIAPVLTRTETEIGYPEELTTVRERKVWDQKHRVEITAQQERAVLVSIHQNMYADSQPHGLQALWSPTFGSRELGETLQELAVSALDTSNKRSAAQIQPDIFLMNSVCCPAVLVECGFLSCPEELGRLQTEEYRTKLAAVLTAGCLIWSETQE